MKWNDGSVYKGKWKKGLQHGKGELYVPTKGWKRGVFQENVLIVVEAEGKDYQKEEKP